MKQLLSCTLLMFSLASFAQKIFFKSPQQFTEEQIENFYSSFNLSDSLVIFKANDYSLYAYNKHTGAQAWKYYMRYKSNTRPHVVANRIWTNVGESDGLMINMDGTEPKKLPFSVYSKPFEKNGRIYTTGIYEAGNILAYDIKADSVLWYRFIAHGCDKLPYYLDDKIFANAEGNNWLELNYDGTILNKNCETDEYDYPTGDGCYDPFLFRTHEGYPVYGKTAEKLDLGEYANPEITTSTNKTFVFHDGRLSILGRKARKLFSEELFELSEQVTENSYDFSGIMKTTDDQVWLMYDNQLIIFDHHKNKIHKIIGLKEWDIHQASVEGDKLWFISKKDGALYGMQLEV